jgi:peroxiredoxin
MKRLLKLVSIATCLLIFLSNTAFAGGDQLPGMNLEEGEPAPGFTLKDILTGEDVTLSDYKGKIVLIQFWATWCAICKREIPFLINHYNKYKDKCDFEILAVLLPSGDSSKKEVKELVKKYNIPYRILDDNKKVATDKYGLTGMIPVLAIVDQDGNLNFGHGGELSVTEDPIPFIIEELCGIEEEDE